MMESHTRTIIRSALWILIGATISISITYLWFNSLWIALSLNLTIITINLGVKLLYEFMFKKVKWGLMK